MCVVTVAELTGLDAAVVVVNLLVVTGVATVVTTTEDAIFLNFLCV